MDSSIFIDSNDQLQQIPTNRHLPDSLNKNNSQMTAINKMRQALADLKISTNQNTHNSGPQDLPTPYFSTEQLNFVSHSQFCPKCEPIIRQLCTTLEKLLAHKEFSSNLIVKKDQELIEVFRLLEESEKRIQYLLNSLEERNSHINTLKQRLEDLERQEELNRESDMKSKNNKIIEYLKAREYQLLTRIKGLELQLINSESLLSTLRLKSQQLQLSQQIVEAPQYKPTLSIFSTKGKSLRNQSLSRYQDSQLKSRRSTARKNQSMNLDGLETEVDIQIRDDLNPEIPGLLKQMQQNMRTLMQQQRILMARNKFLQKCKVENLHFN